MTTPIGGVEDVSPAVVNDDGEVDVDVYKNASFVVIEDINRLQNDMNEMRIIYVENQARIQQLYDIQNDMALWADRHWRLTCGCLTLLWGLVMGEMQPERDGYLMCGLVVFAWVFSLFLLVDAHWNPIMSPMTEDMLSADLSELSLVESEEGQGEGAEEWGAEQEEEEQRDRGSTETLIPEAGDS